MLWAKLKSESITYREADQLIVPLSVPYESGRLENGFEANNIKSSERYQKYPIDRRKREIEVLSHAR
jgi:hypothetical protein